MMINIDESSAVINFLSQVPQDHCFKLSSTFFQGFEIKFWIVENKWHRNKIHFIEFF